MSLVPALPEEDRPIVPGGAWRAVPEMDERVAAVGAAKFWQRVIPSEGCWLWDGYIGTSGHGQLSVKVNGRVRSVHGHRIAYELYVGPVPSGLELGHLCGVPSCVRPDHLEAVVRSESPSRAMARERKARSFYDRWCDNVDFNGPDGCWNWTGGLDQGGYGRVSTGKRVNNGPTGVRSHRLAYMMIKGDIPDGLVLDHLCRNRRCCNPDHLEPVTNAENILRGVSPTALNAAKTHCLRGHPYSDDNLLTSSRGYRSCRTCKNATRRLRRAKRRMVTA